jgi:hypothetical protein
MMVLYGPARVRTGLYSGLKKMNVSSRWHVYPCFQGLQSAGILSCLPSHLNPFPIPKIGERGSRGYGGLCAPHRDGTVTVGISMA